MKLTRNSGNRTIRNFDLIPNTIDNPPFKNLLIKDSQHAREILAQIKKDPSRFDSEGIFSCVAQKCTEDNHGRDDSISQKITWI